VGHLASDHVSRLARDIKFFIMKVKQTVFLGHSPFQIGARDLVGVEKTSAAMVRDA
jgi:hypothetical protein